MHKHRFTIAAPALVACCLSCAVVEPSGVNPATSLPVDAGKPSPSLDSGAPPPPSHSARDASANPLAVDARAPPAQGDAASPAPRVYCDALALFVTERCGGGSCHTNPGATIGDFALGQAQAFQMVDKPSTRGEQCGLIIDSANPTQSLILTKITNPACGALMPVTGADITSEQLTCLADWLEQFRRAP